MGKRILIAAVALGYLAVLAVIGAAYYTGFRELSTWPPKTPAPPAGPELINVIERLRVRREMAEHQVKQLRLDLSRGAAVGLDVPELSSRLQYIRHEVDAREEVEEIDAATD